MNQSLLLVYKKTFLVVDLLHLIFFVLIIIGVFNHAIHSEIGEVIFSLECFPHFLTDGGFLLENLSFASLTFWPPTILDFITECYAFLHITLINSVLFFRD